MALAFKGWGASWGTSWGGAPAGPGSMAAAAGFALSAIATITAQGSLAGLAACPFSAIGVLTAAPPPLPIIPADTFNYRAALSTPKGRYAGDPAIARMALRARRPRRY